MGQITHILLDNGHGHDTPGKRSPLWSDGSCIEEWAYTRLLTAAIRNQLEQCGVQVRMITPEDTDTPLYIRTRRVNQIAQAVGPSHCLLVCVHLNAAREVNSGKGWEVHTSPGNTASDRYADFFWNEADRRLSGHTKMRGDYTDGDRDWDSNFYILQKTSCAAVLTENLFMNHKEDCDFLLSADGFNSIVDNHVSAILNIINS